LPSRTFLRGSRRPVSADADVPGAKCIFSSTARSQVGSEHAERCKHFQWDALSRLHGNSPASRLTGWADGFANPRPREKKRRLAAGDACTREYQVHLLGAELTVRGLAFQQQDVGVSACATIALWSALHRVRETEDIASATPAQITGLASKFRLPYGRSMPSEGLDVEQMCLAVQAIGVSPYLSRVEKFPGARSLLYSATRSGMPAILIIEQAPDCNVKQPSPVGNESPNTENALRNARRGRQDRRAQKTTMSPSRLPGGADLPPGTRSPSWE